MSTSVNRVVGRWAMIVNRAATHNMWAFEDTKSGKAWIMCTDCDDEEEVSKEQLEAFLESVGEQRDVNFMGVVVYHAG